MQNKPAKLPYHIYWFSGTGNSLVIAIEMQKHLRASGCDVQLFPMETANPAAIDTAANIGLVVAVAAQGTYPLVWDFINALPVVKGTPCFLVDTLAVYSGGILGPVKNIIRRKGFSPLAAAEIIMPNNFQRRKNNLQEDMKKIENGKQKARDFCDKLVKGQGHWWDMPGYSWLMSLFYRSMRSVSVIRKWFPFNIDPEKCTHCGICTKLCPVGNLTMQSKQQIPKQGSACFLCHRCFAYCPAHAICIGNKQALAYHALPLKELQQQFSIDKNGLLH